MATPKKRVDRRVQRTRQVLQQAFREVVTEKGFAATSIQDITERANVNRGTFYLHFSDKYMMLDQFIRDDFQLLVANTLTSAACWDRNTLYLLVRAMLDYFGRKYNHQQLVHQAVAPLIERAIHEEMTSLLLTWLKRARSAGTQWRVPAETIARIVSCAIFGAILQWSQEETTISSEQMANDILCVVFEGVVRLVPEPLKSNAQADALP